MTTTATTPASAVALRYGATALAAAAVNTVLGLSAAALDDGGIGMGLTPAAYLPATVVGFVLGVLGWNVLAKRAPRALRVIVPVALALTWIPDVLLLSAGATAANVVGLMLMHLVVATAVVTVGLRRLRVTPGQGAV
ncbi:DUF6069 family protein [Amycolatopsis sp. NBC_00438]|uniref:DUF6069 family protein n=1 Tax=Amycolatopsis sp. NBC_00438 TaxID=2903558 RepID=UPI002E1ECBD0